MSAFRSKNKNIAMGFLKDSSKVFVGISVQRVMSLVMIPVIARLFGPADYGIFNVSAAACALISIIGGLSLETSIAVSSTKEIAAERTIGTALVGVTSGLIYGGIAYLVLPYLTKYYPAEILNALLVMIPIVVPLSVISLSLRNFLGFAGKFQFFAIADIVSPIVNYIGLILSYLFLWQDYHSLIVAAIASYLVRIGIFLYAAVGDQLVTRSRLSLKSFKLLNLIRHFSLFNLPSNFLNNANTQLPPIILSFVFSENIVGIYVMARKIIMIPTTISSNALGQVFYPKAAKEYRQTGRLDKITWQTFLFSSQLTLYPAVLTAAIAGSILPLLLGSRWNGIAVYIILLLPVTLVNAVETQIGFGFIFNILNQQYKILVGNILLFACRIIPLMACVLLNCSEHLTILLFSLGGATGYAILLVWIFTVVSIPIARAFGTWAKYCLIAFFCIFPILGATQSENLSIIISSLVLSTLLYTIIGWFKFLTDEQRSLIVSKIPRYK